MQSTQILGDPRTHAAIPATAPTLSDGIDMTGWNQTTGQVKWLVTAVVTTLASDLFIWGRVAAGTAADASDDVWGLAQDKYGTAVNGKLGTALAVGTHHFIVEDLGIYAGVAFQKSAGDITVSLRPIYAGR